MSFTEMPINGAISVGRSSLLVQDDTMSDAGATEYGEIGSLRFSDARSLAPEPPRSASRSIIGSFVNALTAPFKGLWSMMGTVADVARNLTKHQPDQRFSSFHEAQIDSLALEELAVLDGHSETGPLLHDGRTTQQRLDALVGDQEGNDQAVLRNTFANGTTIRDLNANEAIFAKLVAPRERGAEGANLSDDVKALMTQSPTLMKYLEVFAQAGWTFDLFDPDGPDAAFQALRTINPISKVFSLDESEMAANLEAFVADFADELLRATDDEPMPHDALRGERRVQEDLATIRVEIRNVAASLA